MSIEKISNTLQTATSGKSSNSPKVAVPDGSKKNLVGESFDVTRTTKELKQALAALGTEPVIDTARIEAVRKQLDDGTYTVDAEKLAAKIVQIENELLTAG